MGFTETARSSDPGVESRAREKGGGQLRGRLFNISLFQKQLKHHGKQQEWCFLFVYFIFFFTC